MKRPSLEWRPALSLLLAAGLVFAAAAAGGKTQQGALMFGLLGSFALFSLLGGRRLLDRALHGERHDERSAQLSLLAVRAAYTVLTSTLLVAWLVELARGRSGQPYYWLCLVAACAYLGATVIARLRS